MRDYYTAKEAMKLLKLPNSTFHLLVRRGEIPKVTLPLRKQAIYPKKAIDEIAEKRRRILTELEAKPETLTFVVPTKADLEQLIEIEKMCYHEETLKDPDTIVARMKYNPENIHVLKDIRTGDVVGSITMSELEPKALERLLNLEIDETHLELEDYKPYKSGEIECYVVSIIAKPCIEQHYYASRLLVAIVEYLISLLERGTIIKNIYTVATTEEGEALTKRLHFTPLKTEWTGEYEEFRHSYKLNLEGSSKNKLVNKYIQAKRNLNRRMKRHKTREQQQAQ